MGRGSVPPTLNFGRYLVVIFSKQGQKRERLKKREVKKTLKYQGKFGAGKHEKIKLLIFERPYLI